MFGGQSIVSASDEVLADLVQKGKKAAWEELYERYFDVLFRFSFGYVKNEAIAEDVVQDIFISLPEALKKFDTNRRLKTWLFTLTANRCKNVLRNTENRDRISGLFKTDPVTSYELDRSIDLQILKSEIQQAILSCSDKEKELYHLRFEMDMSINEIAETMNLPEGSVKSGLFYLLKKIRTPLKKISHEYK